MKIRHIILGLGLAGTALTVLVGGIGWGGMRWIGACVDETVRATLATQAATMGDMMHEGLRGDVFQALMYARSGDTAPVLKARAEADEHAQAFLERVTELRQLDLPPDQRADVDRLTPLVARYAEAARELTRLAATDLPAAERGLPDFETQFEQLAVVQDALIEKIEARARSVQQEEDAARQRAERAMLAVTLLGGLSLLGLALAVARHLMRTLGGEPTTVRALLHRVADGELDLAVPLRAGDATSVMAGLQDMVDQLRRTVGEVRGNADAVAGASTQVHAGSSDLAARTCEQAALLETSVQTLAQVSALAGAGAGHAGRASALARAVSDISARSDRSVSDAVRSMDGLRHTSGQIADIIGVIDAIAFQTSILALNASVEAARAGEQGRGFAVVAGEVRALANRSSEAAREIRALIGTSVESVEQGSRRVAQAGSAMNELVASVQQVAGLIGEISRASEAQEQGLRAMHETMLRLEGMTQQNASLVEQSSAAAASLQAQATRLNTAVKVFRVAGGGVG